MKKSVSFVLIVLFIVFACSKKEDIISLKPGTKEYSLAKSLASRWSYLDPDENNDLVTTNHFKITTGEVIQTISKNMGNRITRITSLDPERLKLVIMQNAKNLAEKKLLLEAAREAKTTVTEAQVDSVLNIQYQQANGEQNFKNFLNANGIDFDYVRNEIKTGVIIENYLNRYISQHNQVTEEDIQKEYEQDKTVTVRHILLRTAGKNEEEKKEIRKKMEEILARARKGEDFAALAKKYSEDPGSKNKGGLLENFGRGMTVEPFEEAAFSVPVGEISDIVETRFGYHILKVVERKKETKPLEEVHDQIKSKLQREKEREIYQSLLEGLKQKAEYIEVEL